MKLPYSTPEPALSARARQAKAVRDLATEVARTRSQAVTEANGEENDHGNLPLGEKCCDDREKQRLDARVCYPANFTKGLAHDRYGLLAFPEDYRAFVKAINGAEEDYFDTEVETAESRRCPPDYAFESCGKDEPKPEDEACSPYCCTIPVGDCLTDDELKDKKGYKPPKWRGWESPRSGHAYDLEGPDPGAVGMAPAPRVGSSELAAEMAEVYALAVLRDVPFTVIGKGGKKKLCEKGGDARLSAEQVRDMMSEMPFYSHKAVVSSTPRQVDAEGYNRFERDRRAARTNGFEKDVTLDNLFRGSSPGVLEGPYISQFLLVGSASGAGTPVPSVPSPTAGCTGAKFGLQQGYIRYGTQLIDQRILVHKGCLDYMTCWHSWLDVQNGANLKRNVDQYEDHRRFISTPRDLATYVHFDALYQSYLNACLLMLSFGVPTSRGFPEPSGGGRRGAFATYGDPHILTLVTEVATRCLKAVRRQKFNYHRRARPEALGGRLTLLNCGVQGKLGCAEGAFERTLNELPPSLKDAIRDHNGEQNSATVVEDRRVNCHGKPPLDSFDDCNLLLPMAFPEGSPMHPAYGAGHATVAGGCVTILKAFFDMYEDCDAGQLRLLSFPTCKDDFKACKDSYPYCNDVAYFVPNPDGSELEPVCVEFTKSELNQLEVDKLCRRPRGNRLTIQGELNKLAANISIGRNMAGVHYYSDYYDSLRLGERMAVGILMEQSITYGDEVEMIFDSFDGDRLTISGNAGSCPSLTVLGADGSAVNPRDWWLRHVVGEALSEDF